MTRHFVTPAGVYIGGFCEASEPPEDGIEVFDPPNNAREIWIDGRWKLPLATAQAEAGIAMVGWIDGFLAQFTAGVPEDEVKSWPSKAAAARAHLAGVAQAMILAEAAITGEDPDALAAKIVAKADAFELVMASTTGLRRVTEAAISAAATPEEVSAALATAQKTALSLAARMGLPQTDSAETAPVTQL
jgi:hypothetical protein